MARQFKTSSDQRETYNYYTETRMKITLRSGEDEVTDAHIRALHELDDEHFDSDRRYSAHQAFDTFSGSGELVNALDELPDPVDLAADLEQKEIREALYAAMAKLEPQQQALLKQVFFDEVPQADIARAEGVSKAAITNRMNRIFIQLKKYLPDPR